MNGSGNYLSLLLLTATIPYLFVMMKTISGLHRIKKHTNKNYNTGIKVSVVIATNRDAGQITQLLYDLAHQDYDHNLFEIVIGDDSGGLLKIDYGTPPQEIILKVVPNKATGKKSAVRSAVRASEGEFIITIDDDCRVGPGWISCISSFYLEHHPDMILCPVELNDNKTLFGKMQQLEFLSLQGVTAGTAANNRPVMCNGAGMAFRRNNYPEKGFGTSEALVSGDDIFFMHHLKKCGSAILWLEAKEAIVVTESAADIKSFIRQRSRWASKAGSYKDMSTLFTGISVALLSFTIFLAFLAGIFNHRIILTALLMLVIKSIPDLIIIFNRAKFHDREKLLLYFPLVQLLYPFYATLTMLLGLFRKKKW